jgi:integrase
MKGDILVSKRKNEAVWIENRQRWQIKVQVDGKRKTFTSKLTGKKGKAEAERQADRWIEEPTSAERARVDDLLDQYVKYLEDTKAKGHSSQYEGFVRLHIKPVIGMKRINNLTEGDLQDVIEMAYSKSKLSDKTLRDIRGCLMNWLKWCRTHGKTKLHPDSFTIPAGAKKSVKRIVQPNGLVTLFDSSMTTWRGKPVEDWYIHAYRFEVLTGLRPGELKGLRDKEDVSGNKLTVRQPINIRGETTQGKNENALRTFLLSDRAIQEVKAQRAMLRKAGIVSPYLFPAKNGGPMKHDHYYSCWQRYCKANGIPTTSLYELRHTYVSVNKEMPSGLKKMVIGHSKDMDTEGVYGHQMAGDIPFEF